jgi:ferredoxin
MCEKDGVPVFGRAFLKRHRARPGGDDGVGHRAGEAPMRVVVDFDQCDGNGLCADAAPEVFELGDDDLLRIRAERPEPALWTATEKAARSCPKLAITLRDDA